MGNVFGNLIYDFADRIGLMAEEKEKIRRKQEWLQHPELRKLVPASKCPHCRCRLDGLEVDDSDSEVEIKLRKESKSTFSDKDISGSHETLEHSDFEVEVIGNEKADAELAPIEKIAIKTDYNDGFIEGIPSCIESN